MATVQVDLMHTSKARNSTRVPSTSEGHITETICYLKDPTSVIKPTLIIQGADSTFEGKQFPDYNYCYIKDFHRYYFITNITSISALVWQIDCEVDVLATYRAEILATKAYVMYAQNGYDKYIPDDRFPATTKIESYAYQYTFKNVFDDNGCYTLTVAANSGNGFATTFIMTEGQLNSLVEALNTGWKTIIENDLQNPLDGIVRCSWIPSSPSIAASSSSKEITIGTWSSGVTAPIAKEQVRGNYITSINPPTIEGITYSGYLMVEPYHEYTRWLPGVGVVKLPMSSFHKVNGDNDSCQWLMEACFTPNTGDVSYIFHAGDSDKNAIVMVCNGNVATELPVSSTASNAIGIASGIGMTIGGSLLVAAAPEVGLLGSSALAASGLGSMATGGITQFTSAVQSTTIKGSMSSMATKQYASKMNDRSLYHVIEQNPDASLSTIGRSVFKTLTLGSFTGLVKCTGAFVKAECTDEEHNMIAQYVNTSANYIYGGLIIE